MMVAPNIYKYCAPTEPGAHGPLGLFSSFSQRQRRGMFIATAQHRPQAP